ncbi:hypothetical protein XU18_2958 [Perkinsela sp. CCAP 1560/4]|nr:hypothetical protein XU18_2958 [Perkinsela sp. CCAP 1560/4]|eukprot:KNH06202.1 hypothetical protein XU18_2958 [Perkinsela sp. CCAP 1560/4]
MKKVKSSSSENDQVIDEESVNERVDKLFSLISHNPKKTAVRKSKGGKKACPTDQDGNSVSSAVASLSGMFSIGNTEHSLEPNTQVEKVATDVNISSAGLEASSWQNAVLYRLSLEPWCILASRLSLLGCADPELSNAGEHFDGEKYSESVFCPKNLDIVLNPFENCDSIKELSLKSEKSRQALSNESLTVEKVHSYLMSIKNSLSSRAGRSGHSTADSLLTYDKNYWKQRCTKNRSLIPIGGGSYVPAFHSSLYNDGDLLKQIQVDLKNHAPSATVPQHGIEWQSEKLHKKRKSHTSHSGIVREQPDVTESNATQKLKGFCSLHSKAKSPPVSIAHSLFSE